MSKFREVKTSECELVSPFPAVMLRGRGSEKGCYFSGGRWRVAAQVTVEAQTFALGVGHWV